MRAFYGGVNNKITETVIQIVKNYLPSDNKLVAIIFLTSDQD